jgi:hypothetical protein
MRQELFAFWRFFVYPLCCIFYLNLREGLGVRLPYFPTEVGLAVEHLEAVFRAGTALGGLPQQQGRRRVVDKVVNKLKIEN